jgi:hypothetical protein
MAAKKTVADKKFFTPAQANAMLPLVRRIVEDITTLVAELKERHARLSRLQQPHGTIDEAHREELHQVEADFERAREQMGAYIEELTQLGVELKDPVTGLIDFPWWKDGREVSLCWRLGEAEVGHWHELDAGFAGRQKLLVQARTE